MARNLILNIERGKHDLPVSKLKHITSSLRGLKLSDLLNLPELQTLEHGFMFMFDALNVFADAFLGLFSRILAQKSQISV